MNEPAISRPKPLGVEIRPEPLWKRKQKREPPHEVYVVTVVEYEDGKACAPVLFAFDNEPSATACLKYLSKDTNKIYLTKEEVYGSFCVGGQI